MNKQSKKLYNTIGFEELKIFKSEKKLKKNNN